MLQSSDASIIRFFSHLMLLSSGFFFIKMLYYSSSGRGRIADLRSLSDAKHLKVEKELAEKNAEMKRAIVRLETQGEELQNTQEKLQFGNLQVPLGWVGLGGTM